jgi:stage II sporulation protein AA (anti-sigma F factor antagonist)
MVGGWLRAELEGELDVATAPAFRTQIDAALARHQARRLQLDLARVGFIDSSGVGAILGRYRQLQLVRGELVLVGIPRRLRPVLELSGLGRVIALEPRARSRV